MFDPSNVFCNIQERFNSTIYSVNKITGLEEKTPATTRIKGENYLGLFLASARHKTTAMYKPVAANQIASEHKAIGEPFDFRERLRFGFVLFHFVLFDLVLFRLVLFCFVLFHFVLLQFALFGKTIRVPRNTG